MMSEYFKRFSLTTNDLGLILIGLASYCYFVWSRYFAEKSIVIPGFGFPIFIGEILLGICLILFFLNRQENLRKIAPVFQISILTWIAFIGLKALWGCHLFGPLAFRHAALFYYSLFAVLGYAFFNHRFFTSWKKAGLVLLMMITFKLDAFLRPDFLLGFFLTGVLILTHPEKRFKLIAALILLVVLPYKHFVLVSRTELVAIMLTSLYLFIAFSIILKCDPRLKIVIGLSLLGAFVVSLFFLENKSNLNSLFKIDKTKAEYDVNNQKIQADLPTFHFKPLKEVKLYNKEKTQAVKDAQNQFLTNVYSQQQKTTLSKPETESVNAVDTTQKRKEITKSDETKIALGAVNHQTTTDVKTPVNPIHIKERSNETKIALEATNHKTTAYVASPVNPSHAKDQKNQTTPVKTATSNHTLEKVKTQTTMHEILPPRAVPNQSINNQPAFLKTINIDISTISPELMEKLTTLAGKIPTLRPDLYLTDNIQNPPSGLSSDDIKALQIKLRIIKDLIKRYNLDKNLESRLVSGSDEARNQITEELENRFNLKNTEEKGLLPIKLRKVLYLRDDETAGWVIGTILVRKRSEEAAIGNSLFRVFIWQDIWDDLIKEKPFVGFNFGKPFRSKRLEILSWAEGEWRRDGWIEMHNAFFDMIYRAGLISIAFIITVLVVLVYMIKNFIRLKSVPGILLTGALIYWMAMANVSVILEVPYHAILFWSLFGMTLAYCHYLLSSTIAQKV